MIPRREDATYLINGLTQYGFSQTNANDWILTNKDEITPSLMNDVKKDPEKARLYFRQVIDSFPKSFYAQQAKLAIADSYFKKGGEGNMILAASEYREFISLFPYSPSAPRAQYQIAMTYYKKMG